MIPERGEVCVRIYGEPAPQGSKRHVGNGVMIESSKKVAPWREAVKWGLIHGAALQQITGPVTVAVTFYLPRPKSAKVGAVPFRKPDLDKLLRSTFDAINDTGLIEDDARIVTVVANKLYADAENPNGAAIKIYATKGGRIW